MSEGPSALLESVISQIETSPESVDWDALSRIKISSSDYYTYKNLVSKHQDKPWNWNRVMKKISNNDLLNFINFETVVSNPDCNWDWYNLTYEFSYCIKLEKFIETKHLPWEWDELSDQSVYNINLIKNNLDIPWNWSEISLKITSLSHFDVVKNNLDLNWNWDILSKNMNMLILGEVVPFADIPAGYFVVDDFDKFMQNYFDLPWNWDILSCSLTKDRLYKIDLKMS